MKGIRASITDERTLRFENHKWRDPKKFEILVQAERTIISAGTELANYTGLDPDTRRKGAWCAYPWVPGYGGIGRVVAKGSGVKHLEEGDRVYGTFQHASYTLVNVHSQLAVKVPKKMDLNEAIFTRMACVAITGMRRATVNVGDTVLVFGLGLVGNLAGQFFAMNGQRVIGVDPVEHRRKLAESCGFHSTLDPSEKLRKRVSNLTDGHGPRVVVDAVGQSQLVIQGVELAARGGQVILLGTPRAPHKTNCTPFLDAVHRRGIDLIGALEWLYPVLGRWDLGNAITIEGNVRQILGWIKEGKLNVKPLLSHLIDPMELDDAYKGLLDRKDEYLGVVLDWTQLKEG